MSDKIPDNGDASRTAMARIDKLLELIERLDRMQENHAYRTPIEQILIRPQFEPPDIETVGVFEAMRKKIIFKYVTKVLPDPVLKI